jgi:hypothetical protein
MQKMGTLFDTTLHPPIHHSRSIIFIVVFASGSGSSEGSGYVGAVNGGVMAIEDGHIKERCAGVIWKGRWQAGQA